MQTTARPWPRFLARHFDLLLFALSIGILLAIIAPSLYDSVPTDDKNKDNLFSLAIIFLWVPVEAILMSTWGATPGKSVLGIRVLSKNGTKLTFAIALKRSLSVWRRGVAIGLPLFNLIAEWIAYRRLKKTGSTSWDSDLQISVFQEPISTLRTIIFAILLIGLFLLVVILVSLAQ